MYNPIKKTYKEYENEYDQNYIPPGQDQTIYHRQRVRKEIASDGNQYYDEDKVAHYQAHHDYHSNRNGQFSADEQYDGKKLN